MIQSTEILLGSRISLPESTTGMHPFFFRHNFFFLFFLFLSVIFLLKCEAQLSAGLTSNQLEEDQIRFCSFLYYSAENSSEKDRVLRECLLPVLLKQTLEEKGINSEEKIN